MAFPEVKAGTEITDAKNAVMTAIHSKMGICPYYGTNELLDDVLIQKSSWGGKNVPENTVRLSAAANVDYMNFAATQNVLSGQSAEYYQKLYADFLQAPKPELTERERGIQILKVFVALREAFLNERMAMVARLRTRGQALDDLFPMDKAYKTRLLEKFRIGKEPVLKQIKEEKDASWQNLIGYATADMGYVQKTIIEAEIAALVEKHPMWEFFGKFIPGFGTWTCALFIAKLQDPTRFPKSGHVRAFCGMAPMNGKTMKRERGKKLTYDPGMKEVLCEIFPDSFMKTSARNPDEPYAVFFQECRKKQAKKAEETKPEQLAKQYGVPVENITNLGYEEKEEGKRTFKGFKVKKADGDEITTLNPGHVLQRAKREFGSMFISDFYHAWLFLMGENPRIEGNPRIMGVLEKVKS